MQEGNVREMYQLARGEKGFPVSGQHSVRSLHGILQVRGLAYTGVLYEAEFPAIIAW